MRRDEQGPPPLVEVRWAESVAELQAVRFAGADEMDDDERRNHESVVREINDPHPRGN